jgi:tetratricopeptide (TPR) repeat protein
VTAHAPGDVDGVRLARRALDRSPADLQAHEVLAAALGDTPGAEQVLRAAIAVGPWSTDGRDRLALRLFRRGGRSEGIAELEESVFRAPSLGAHPLLDAGGGSAPHAPLTPADAHGFGALEPEILDAVERGLTRALEAGSRNPPGLVDDLATIREVRGRWAEAAVILRARADETTDAMTLARAARDYLKAGDASAAEQVLLVALRRQPGQGALYRRLAVEVYAARGDFGSAESILRAGEQNAYDRLPIYQAMTEVLARRDTMPPAAPAHVAEKSDGSAAQEGEDLETP